MNFSEYLQFMLHKNELRQIELLNKLQSLDAPFHSLDSITLSRWCNNKTRPSLKKQLLVASVFEKKISYFIQHIGEANIPSAFLKAYNSHFNKIENPYVRLGYKLLDKNPPTLSMLDIGTIEHRQLFCNFYTNMETYNRIYKRVNESNKNITTTVFVIKHGEQIVSHLGFNCDVTQLQQFFKQQLPSAPKKKSIIINVGYYDNRNYYELLVGHLGNHVIDNYLDFDELYLVARGSDALFLLEQFGGKLVLTAPESKFIGNIYLLKIEIKELLAHPFIFKQVQKYYFSYMKLKENPVDNPLIGV